MFTGFPEETFQFFLDIRFHNDSLYFNEHRERYQQDVQRVFYDFIDALAPAMLKIDHAMEVRPAKCLARLRRDTRFTKDKTPYRDHLWITFRPGGEGREGNAMFWFELGLETMSWGMGIWGDNRPVTDRMRRQIAAKPHVLQNILDDLRQCPSEFRLEGSILKKLAVPETVPDELMNWYRAKELYVSRLGITHRWCRSKALVDRVRKDYMALSPLYQYLRGIYRDEMEMMSTPTNRQSTPERSL